MIYIYTLYMYIFPELGLLVIDHHLMAQLSWTSWQVIEPIEGPGSQMCSTKGSGAAIGWVGQR